jgi:hypothetical protein
VLGIESVWKALDPALLKAKSKHQVQTILEEFVPLMGISIHFQQSMIDAAAVLFEFISSGRLRKTGPSRRILRILGRRNWDLTSMKAAMKLPTRQLASAIAGAPELSWQRSLDRCAGFPSYVPIHSAMAECYQLPGAALKSNA